MKFRFLSALFTLSFVYSMTGFSLTTAAPLPAPAETKLTAADAGIEKYFGRAVAVHGDTAVVGSPNNSVTSDGSGSAYVFVRSASGWQFQQKLTASDASPQSFFGVSVAIDGEKIVVGANGDPNAGQASGAAYVFVRSGNTWAQEQKLTGSENSPNDAFGLSVGIKGSTIVCGAFGNSVANSATEGSVYVFRQTSNGWVESQKLVASDASYFNSFGGSVAISDDTIVVGAIGNEEFGFFSGAVYVFTFDGSNWTEQIKLHAQDASTRASFGYRVGIDKDTIVAASDGYVETETRSAVYVFRRNSSGWHQQKRIVINDAGILGRYGLTVAVSGATIVIGSQNDFAVAPYAGSAYIYRRSGESSWTLYQKFRASDAAYGDNFGNAVAISGNTVLVGAFGKSDVAIFAGAAYLFDFVF
jgi:FG-GAP repeat